MLAGDPYPDIRPVMGEHVFVMPGYDLVLRRKRRVRQPPSTPQPLDRLLHEPRPAIAATADHQPIGTGFGQCTIGVVEIDDVAIGNDRDRDRVLDLTDKVPIGAPGEHLTAGATMYRNHPDTAGLGDLGN